MEFVDLKKQYEALKPSIDSAIASVLANTDFILGASVTDFEKEIARYVGRKHCITCGNGTDALSLALKALNIGKNDVVFVPTFTFFASAEVVNLNGSACAFVDIDKDTFNISTESLIRTIELVLRDGRYKPKAIMAVDLFGQCANYIELAKIAEKYNLLIIEDGAQGFGGTINGKKACSFGDISTTSFFPAKPLGCYGDGGAIFTDNDDVATLLRSLRFHGKGANKYDNVRIGYNSRLDTIQASILKVKLNAFDNELKLRHAIAKKYNDRLKDIVKTPFLPLGYSSSYAQYTLTLDNSVQRSLLQKRLASDSIPSMVYYPKCMHEQTVYDGYKLNLDDLKVGEHISNTVLSLPMHPYLTDDEINQVCDSITAFFKN